MFVTQEGFVDAQAQELLSQGQHAWDAVKVPSWSGNWFMVTYEQTGKAHPCLDALLISSRDTVYDFLCLRRQRVTAVSLMAFDGASRRWKSHEVAGIWIAHELMSQYLSDSMVLTLNEDPTLRTPQLIPLPRSVQPGACLFLSGQSPD